MKKKKNRGIVALKAKYGWICISPWVIGLSLFFIIPIIQSVIYAFSDVSLMSGGLNVAFVGLNNFKYIFVEDADYLNYMMEAIIEFLYSFPIIMIISLILALMLNQNFKGRILFRALYFLPVIIASGPVLSVLMSSVTDGITDMAQDESVAMAMFDVSAIVSGVGLPEKVGNVFIMIIERITTLIWSCGIQTVLFIAGMQSIPELMYEVSKVEGATRWEEFWFITLPMLARVSVLVAVFTMVELMTSSSNTVMIEAYTNMKLQYYGESSAMLWSYFSVIGIFMVMVLGLYNKLCLKKWE